MIKVNGYSSYFGGKSGNGTYQTIINHIPPHDCLIVPFAGNCGVCRHIRPAKKLTIVNDLDPFVTQAWERSSLPSTFQVLNLTARDLIAKFCYDSSTTFIYLDPPYRKESRKSQADVYRFEMTDNDHSDLLTQISAVLQARIMISHYPDKVYDEALKGWHTHDFYSQTRNGLALERLYMNYQIGDELHDYSYIGADYREREKLARIKKNFVKKLKRLPALLRNSILADIIPQ